MYTNPLYACSVIMEDQFWMMVHIIHFVTSPAVQQRTFVVEFIRYNQPSVEFLVERARISDFQQFFKLHVMACEPPKPDLFLVYMLCRGLGVHAGIAHDAGMWRTSKGLYTEPDVILVYTTSGFHPCVRHEPDWTHVMPPKDKPSKSSQHPDTLFKSVHGIAKELVSAASEAFPEDFTHATPEEYTTPTDATTAGVADNCEPTAEMCTNPTHATSPAKDICECSWRTYVGIRNGKGGKPNSTKLQCLNHQSRRTLMTVMQMQLMYRRRKKMYSKRTQAWIGCCHEKFGMSKSCSCPSTIKCFALLPLSGWILQWSSSQLSSCQRPSSCFTMW